MHIGILLFSGCGPNLLVRRCLALGYSWRVVNRHHPCSLTNSAPTLHWFWLSVEAFHCQPVVLLLLLLLLLLQLLPQNCMLRKHRIPRNYWPALHLSLMCPFSVVSQHACIPLVLLLLLWLLLLILLLRQILLTDTISWSSWPALHLWLHAIVDELSSVHGHMSS